MPEVFQSQEWVLTHKGTAVWVSMITTADGMMLIQSNDTHDNPDIPPSGIYSKSDAREVWKRLIEYGWKWISSSKGKNDEH